MATTTILLKEDIDNLGGRGEIRDLMVLLLWLQGLWAAAQAVMLVCVLVAPVLATFLLLFIALATIWVFVHFISIGLQLNSMIRAVVVLIVGTIALIIGTGFLLSLIGVSSLGVPPGV